MLHACGHITHLALPGHLTTTDCCDKQSLTNLCLGMA